MAEDTDVTSRTRRNQDIQSTIHPLVSYKIHFAFFIFATSLQAQYIVQRLELGTVDGVEVALLSLLEVDDVPDGVEVL